MLQREERLKIIQAEIDRCTSEIHSLGCDEYDAQEPQKKRRADTLNLVINELNAIRIDGKLSVILQPVLDSAKDTFIQPLQNIIQLDFKRTEDWEKLINPLSLTDYPDIVRQAQSGLELYVKVDGILSEETKK